MEARVRGLAAAPGTAHSGPTRPASPPPQRRSSLTMVSSREIVDGFVLLVSWIVLIMFVVMEGQNYPNYQFALAFISAVVFAPAFMAVHLTLIVAKERRMPHLADLVIREAGWTRRDWAKVAGVGFFWSLNYVFLLSANPYIPGVAQNGLVELSLAGVVLTSIVAFGRRYTLVQWAAVALVVGGIILLALSNAATAEPSALPQGVWYLFYAIGAGAIGVANAITENVVKRFQTMSVSLFYAWVTVFTFLFVVAWLWVAPLSDSNWAADLRDGIATFFTVSSAGVAYVWIAAASNFISTMYAAYVSRSSDATFATLIGQLGPIVAVVLMSSRAVFGQYYSPVSKLEIGALVVVLLGVLTYKAEALVRGRRKDTTGHAEPLLDAVATAPV
jgi:drug/metabolite transporter (DMT)-like permease